MSGNRKLLRQIVKFGFVGGTAFLIDYGVLFCLTEFLGVHYLISGTISFALSVIYNYILSIKWVFDTGNTRKKSEEFVVFLILSIIGLGINQVIMWLAVEKLQLYYMISKIFATAVVMVYNFVTRKMFLEK